MNGVLIGSDGCTLAIVDLGGLDFAVNVFEMVEASVLEDVVSSVKRLPRDILEYMYRID